MSFEKTLINASKKTFFSDEIENRRWQMSLDKKTKNAEILKKMEKFQSSVM